MKPTFRSSLRVLLLTTMAFSQLSSTCQAADPAPLLVSIAENVPSGSVVAALQAVDPDPGETFVFTLVAGTGADNNAAFSLVGNELRTIQPLDAEISTQLTCRVRVTDSGLNSYDQVVRVTVINDANEDADGDGLTEAQEAALGLNDLNPDVDGDVALDGLEVAAGTDPKDPLSTPPFTRVTVRGSGSMTKVPATLTDAVQTALGREHALALRKNGTVVAWGMNTLGQTSVPALAQPASVVIARGDSSAAILADGSLVTWGSGALDSPLAGPFVDALTHLGSWLCLRPNGTVEVATPAGTTPPATDFSAVSGISELVSLSSNTAGGLNKFGVLQGWIGVNATMVTKSQLFGFSSCGAGGTSWSGLGMDGKLYWGSNINTSGGTAFLPGPLRKIAVQQFNGRLSALFQDGTVQETSSGMSPSFFQTVASKVAAIAAGTSSFAYIQTSTPPPVPGEWLHFSTGAVNWTPPLASGSATEWKALGLPSGLSINPATGNLSGSVAPGKYVLRVFAANSVAQTDGRALLEISQGGNPPTNISLSPASAAENAAVNTTIFQLSATDADPADSFVFSLIPGLGSDHNAVFTLLGSTLTLNAAVDFEQTPVLRLRALVTDSTGNRFIRSLSVSVINDATEDFDKDGLTEAQELALGTKDTLADSDSDGFSDGVEVAKGTNPMDAISKPLGAKVYTNYSTTTGLNVVPDLDDPIQLATGEGGLVFAMERAGRAKVWGTGNTALVAAVNTAPSPTEPPGIWINAGGQWGGMLRSDASITTWGNCPTPPSTATASVDFSALPSVLVTVGTDGRLHWHGSLTMADAGVSTAAGLNDVLALWAGLQDVVRFRAAIGWGVAIRADGTHVTWGTLPSTFPTTGLSQLTSLQIGQKGWSASWQDGTAACKIATTSPIVYMPAAQVSAVFPLATGLPSTSRPVVTRTFEGDLLISGNLVPFWSTFNRPTTGYTDIACSGTASSTGLLAAIHSGGSGFQLNGPDRVSVTEGNVDSSLSSVAWPSGVSQPLTWKALGLPAGLSLDPQTGRVSGMASVGKTVVRIWADSPFARVHRVIQLAVTDAGNITPSGVAVSPAQLSESTLPGSTTAPGTPVAQLTAIDPDLADTHTFQLVNGPGGDHNSYFLIQGSSLYLIRPLDFETLPALSVRISATDASGAVGTSNLTFVITDVDTDDTDRDGLTQSQETALGTSDQLADTDGDSANDGLEIRKSTNPLNPASVPQATQLHLAVNSGPTPIVPPDLETVAISTTGSSTLLLQRNGTVAALPALSASHTMRTWSNLADIVSSTGSPVAGITRSGQLLTTGGPLPPADLGPVVDAAVSSSGGMALLGNGTVRTWGSGISQLMLAAARAAAKATGVLQLRLNTSYGALLQADGTILGFQSTTTALENQRFTGNAIDADTSGLAIADGLNPILYFANFPGFGVPPTEPIVQIGAGASLILRGESGGIQIQGKYPFNTVSPSFQALHGLQRAINVANAAVLTSVGAITPSLNVPTDVSFRLGVPATLAIGDAISDAEYFALGIPSGLSLDPTTGTLTGTPTEVGRHVVRFFVRSSAGQREERRLVPVTTGSPPTAILLANNAIAENLPAGTEVGQLSVPNTAAAKNTGTKVGKNGPLTYTFSLINGAGAQDNAKFSILANKLLTTQPLDAETQANYSVRIRVTDSNANSIDKTFSITAVDTPEAPSFAAWLSSNGLTATDPHPASGQPAVVSYAFGLSYGHPSAPPMAISTATTGAGQFLEIRYRRLAGATTGQTGASYDSSYGGVTYTLMKSTSHLGGWAPAMAEFDCISTELLGSEVEICTLRSKTPVGTAGKVFYRINIGTAP